MQTVYLKIPKGSKITEEDMRFFRKEYYRINPYDDMPHSFDRPYAYNLKQVYTKDAYLYLHDYIHRPVITYTVVDGVEIFKSVIEIGEL